MSVNWATTLTVRCFSDAPDDRREDGEALKHLACG
jgi:hypothetical protein